jgi:hypothetical protein
MSNEIRELSSSDLNHVIGGALKATPSPGHPSTGPFEPINLGPAVPPHGPIVPIGFI